MRTVLWVAALILYLAPTARAAPPRILYAGDWLGHMEIFALDPAGKSPPGQITSGAEPDCVDQLLACGFVDPLPSPDGRWILYRGTGRLPSLWVAKANGSDGRQVLPPGDLVHATGGLAGDPAWSRNSKRFAYTTVHAVHVFRVTDGRDQVVASGIVGDVAWSPDGRSLYVLSSSALYRVRGGRSTKLADKAGCSLRLSPDARWLATVCPGPKNVIRLIRLGRPVSFGPVVGRGIEVAWSPDGHRLAVHGPSGISVYDVRTRRTRVLARDAALSASPDYWYAASLGLAWSPDGRSIAYIVGALNSLDRRDIRSGNLRVVTLAGRARTIVSGDRAYGGRMLGVSWARARGTLRYRTAEPAPLERVTAESVLADGPIDRLAADGPRVAFSACQHVFTWVPGSLEVTGLTGSCFDLDRYAIYEVALAGDRLGYADITGCNFIRQQLLVRPVDSTSGGSVVANGFGGCGSPFHPAVGRLIGSGGLLVFSTWTEVLNRGVPRTTLQSVSRLDSGGCPCPVIASSSGPLVPSDIDAGRVVVFGDNETWILDRAGQRLLSLHVSPAAAQLTGSNLLLALPGQLRDYDAGTGELLHTWTMPDVQTGPDCDFHCGPTPTCLASCRAYPLVLEDAARGLVAYVFDGRVHVLRIADGADAVVAGGRIARFVDSGLVYANGSRISFVPFVGLPLLTFG